MSASKKYGFSNFPSALLHYALIVSAPLSSIHNPTLNPLQDPIFEYSNTPILKEISVSIYLCARINIAKF